MILKVVIDNKVVEQIYVSPKNLQIEGYLEGLQKDLQKDYEDHASDNLQVYLDEIPSKMNLKQFFD